MTFTFKVLMRSVALAIPSFFALQAHAWQHDNAQAAAHELAEAAEHVHQQAEFERHDFTWREEEALRNLHELSEAAEHLHMQIESYWQDPRHTWQDYQRVVLSMQHVRWTFRGGHFSEHVFQDWYRVEDAFRRLQFEYAAEQGGFQPGYPGYNHGGYYPAPSYPYPSPGYGSWGGWRP